MQRTRVRYAGAAAALAAAVLAGCGNQGGMGGQEGEVPPAPPAPTGQPPGGMPPEGQPPAGQDPAAAKQALQDQVNQQLQQNPITFEPDSAELTPQSQESITKLAEAAKQAPPEVRFQVVGHVAKTGSPENAQQLSQERAQAVVDELAASGVPADRMEAVGKSDMEPKESMEASRRVEIVVM